MGWFIFPVMLLVIGIVIWQLLKRVEDWDEASSFGKPIFWSIVTFVVGLLLAFTINDMIFTVETGHVGVVKHFGAVTEAIYEPGIHTKAPFVDEVVQFSTIKKTFETTSNVEESQAEYTDNEDFANTSDGQRIALDVTVRFRIDPQEAPWILANLGTEKNYVETIVKPETRTIVRRVPNKFTAAELYTKASYDAQQMIYTELKERFEANHIILDEFNIRQIEFTQAYRDTIEAKQIEFEKVVTAKNRADQAKYTAEQKVTEAQGEADAIRIKNAALKESTSVIQWEAIQKLNPNVQVIMVPAGSNFLFNMNEMMKK